MHKKLIKETVQQKNTRLVQYESLKLYINSTRETYLSKKIFQIAIVELHEH